MGERYKELIDNVRQTQQDYAIGKERLDKLKTRPAELARDIPSLLQVVEKTRAAKDTAVGLFAAGDIDQSGLDEARGAFERAIKTHLEAEEVLSSVDKHIRDAQNNITRLSNAMAAAQNKLWRHILEDLGAKVRNQVRVDMARVIAAAVLCGSDIRLYGSVVGSVIGPFTEKEIMEQCNVLKAEYLTAKGDGT